MADLGNLHFGVHLKDFTDAEADKIRKKLDNLSVRLTIDGKNVTISQTDLIKKQIEDAIKSVSVQSVKIDTNAVRTQMNTALQGLNPQVSVSIAKGALSNDLQNYLNTKAFTVGITITRGNAQNAINTAFANISVPVNVTVSASAALQQLRQSLANQNVKIGVEAKDVSAFVADVEKRLKGRKIKVDVEPNQQHLVQAMKQALQGVSVKAQVKVDVDALAITNAVQSAINNAKFTYHPNGGSSRSGGGSSRRSGGSSSGWNPNAERGLYESARASLTLGSSLRTNIRLAGELGTSLGNLVSIFGIKDLVANVVRIGGELENQKIALGAILQDGGKATEMFSKIQSLAVKSPFGIMDLNKYSKQLAAYGIEYNELYDTMKRMADISAGVGVDMGRIILAFGQVRAAGFLKGTELRQFTEANIPMVQALADRFSILEKRIVSAGEVYDMISEKKVSFEDVKAVLWELTGEGGRFNNMQEVLSESLASKWKNLSDAIDVMYGKIAEGTIGDWAKDLAEGLTEVTKQWEYVATAIKSAAAAYLVYKNQMNGKQAVLNAPMNNLLASKQKEAEKLRLVSLYRNLTSAEEKLLRTTNELNIADMKRAIRAGELSRSMAVRLIQLKQVDAATARYLVKLYAIQQQELQAAVKTNIFRSALTGLWTTIKGVGAALKTMVWNPFTGLFLAFSAVAEIFTYYNKKAEEVKQRNEDVAESAKGSAETLERELLKIKDLDISKMNTDEMKIKVNELTTVIQNEADGWQSILSEIFAKEADGTFKNSVEEQLRLLKTKMDELAEAKKKLMGDNESYSDVIGETKTGVLFWEKDIIDRVKAYSQAVDENDKKLKDLAIHAREVSAALKTATAGNIGIQKLLEGKNLNEQVALLKDYKTEWSKFVVELTKSSPEAAQIVNSWYNSIEKFFVKGKHGEMLWDFNLAKNKMVDELTLQGEEIGKLTETGRQYVIGFVDGLIKEAAVQKPSVQQYIYDWFTGQFGLPRNDLGYLIPSTITDITSGGAGDSKKDAVAEMWKKRAAEIEKAVKIYDKWKAIEGRLLAENRVKGSDEFANLFSGVYGFNLDLESPTDAYEYIQKLLDSSKDKQKELMVNLGVKISDAEYNDAKREFDKRLNELKEYAKDTVSKWELYKKLFDATGDKSFAKSAFDNTQVWDDAAREMKKNLEEEMDKQGSLVELDFTISDESAKEAFEGKSGLYELWKEIKDRIEKNGIDVKVNAAKAIESVQSIQDKIKSKKEQRDEELKMYSEGTQEYDSVAKKWENEITELEGELYELSPAFKSLFVDTTGMASGKVHELWQQAKNLVDLIRSNTTKIVYDQNGQIKGRYYKDNEGKEQYISEESFKNLGEQTNKLAKKVPEVKVAFNNLWDAIRGNGKEGYKFKDIAQDVSVLAKEAANTASALSSMFDSLGNESAADVAAFTGDMLNSVSQIGEGIASGNPLAIISGIANGISSIAQFHDKKLDRAIKKSQLEVQKLSNEYKNLEATLERQLGSATSSQSSKMLNSLKKQRSELQKQYEAEDDKKKTDKSKLEDYKQQITELNDQIKHFYEDLASEQYGVDIKGWASQLASALTEAFASGEDAAMAFDNTVGDILRSLATEAIKLQFIEPAMANLKSYMFGQNGIFTDNSEMGTDLSANEAVGIGKELDKLKEQIEASNEFWDKINDAVGGILGDTENAGKDGLSKGIQSVTEDTANLLASYVNSIRQSVHVKQQLIEKLVSDDIPKINYLAEAQLRELSQIQSNTARNVILVGEIRDLINKVVDKGSNKLKI
jgi:tape measure domain-containing protein